MSQIEGMGEAFNLIAIPTKVLFDILGFASKGIIDDVRKGFKTIIKAPPNIVMGSVKSIRSHKERDEFLRGGEATCEEIFKEKGSLPDQVDTIDNITSWDSPEGEAFIKACEEAHVKIAPLKSEPVSFMYHSSDAEKLVVGYNKLIEIAGGDKSKATHKTETSDKHYEGLDDLDNRDREVMAIVKDKENDYLKTLGVNENEVLSKSEVEALEKKFKDLTPSKNLNPTHNIPLNIANEYKNGEYGFLGLPTEKGIALIPNHSYKKSKTDLMETVDLFIDPEQSYPFKDVNGNTNSIMGKDLSKELERLEKLKEKQLKLLEGKSKAVNDNVVLGKDLGGKSSKDDALGRADSLSEHLSRGDYKAPPQVKTK